MNRLMFTSQGLTFIFYAVLGIACGQNKTSSSTLTGSAPQESDCRGQILNAIPGTNDYYNYTAVTFPDNPSAHNNGKIQGCYYPTKEEALNDVRTTCAGGQSATCSLEYTWQLDSKVYTSPINPSSHMLLPAPPEGGCYKKWTESTSACSSVKKQKSCEQDWPYNLDCAWALIPPPPTKVQVIKYGTLNWVQSTTFSYVDWNGSPWTATIDSSDLFRIVKYGTLNWLEPQKNIQIKQIVIVDGAEVEQNVLLEKTGTQFQYILNGTLNWNIVPNFEYRSWELPGGNIVFGRSTVEIVK